MVISIKQLPKKDFTRVRPLVGKLLIYEAKNFINTLLVNKKGLSANFKYEKKQLDKYKGALFVALDDSKIIGYAMGWIEKSKPWCKNKEFGNFEDLFVEERYRGKGISKMLMNAMLAWFKGKVKYVEIGGYTANPSIQIYKHMGFSDYSTDLRMRLK